MNHDVLHLLKLCLDGVVNTLGDLVALAQADIPVCGNLDINIYKYARRGTRVYIDLATNENKALLTIRNISAEPVNLDSAMLTERFIRGDISRGTEGSGLGLSIAKSLAEAQNGRLDLSLDGDLFKVVVSFDLIV